VLRRLKRREIEASFENALRFQNSQRTFFVAEKPQWLRSYKRSNGFRWQKGKCGDK
jgi:hypothetical protein